MISGLRGFWISKGKKENGSGIAEKKDGAVFHIVPRVQAVAVDQHHLPGPDGLYDIAYLIFARISTKPGNVSQATWAFAGMNAEKVWDA